MPNYWRRKRLGNTHLFVTPLCWGCAPLGNIPIPTGVEVSEDQGVEIASRMLESPVNFLDTSSVVYGESEKRIGMAIRKRGGFPADFVLATKADRDLKANDFSATQIRKSVLRSIALLGLSPLDLVYLHDPEYHPLYNVDRKAAMEEMLGPAGAVAELEKMKQEGLISYIGISGGPIEMLLEFVQTSRFDAVINHNRWNLLWQTADPLIEAAHKMSIGIVNAGVYASGLLVTGPIPNARAVYRRPWPDILDRYQAIKEVCGRYNVPVAAAALQFSLRDSRISSTAVGISLPEQIEETLRFAQVSIPEDLWGEMQHTAVREGDPERMQSN